MLFFRPRLIFLFFCRFSAENILVLFLKYSSFLLCCILYICITCTVHRTVISDELSQHYGQITPLRPVMFWATMKFQYINKYSRFCDFTWLISNLIHVVASLCEKSCMECKICVRESAFCISYVCGTLFSLHSTNLHPNNTQTMKWQKIELCIAWWSTRFNWRDSVMSVKSLSTGLRANLNVTCFCRSNLKPKYVHSGGSCSVNYY